MKTTSFLSTGILAGIASLAMAVQADTLQSHRSIQVAAEEFISARVKAVHGVLPEATAGRLDPRLRLAECDSPLESFLPGGGRMLGNTSVGIRCDGSKTWTLYVPVKVSVYETIVAAARPVARGEIIEAQHLALVDKDLAQLNSGYFTDRNQLIGKQATRPVLIGAAFSTQMIKNARQIKRGDRVSLVAKSGGLQVRMAGKALEDGALGDKIEVRNLSSKRVIEGVVLTRGTVQVDL